MEIPCSWPLHIRSSIANELRLTHLIRSRTLLRRPSGGSYAPAITYMLKNLNLLITLQTQLVLSSSNSSSHCLSQYNRQYHEEVHSHTSAKIPLQEHTCHQVLGDNTREFFQIYQDTSLSLTISMDGNHNGAQSGN